MSVAKIIVITIGFLAIPVVVYVFMNMTSGSIDRDNSLAGNGQEAHGSVQALEICSDGLTNIDNRYDRMMGELEVLAERAKTEPDVPLNESAQFSRDIWATTESGGNVQAVAEIAADFEREARERSNQIAESLVEEVKAIGELFDELEIDRARLESCVRQARSGADFSARDIADFEAISRQYSL